MLSIFEILFPSYLSTQIIDNYFEVDYKSMVSLKLIN